MNQEQLMTLQMIEQEANQLNQQIEIIESNISELEDLRLCLNELEKNENREILANLGKKIFLPVEIKKKELIVEVGNKNFVKKSIPETRKIIEEQLSQMNSLKMQLVDKIEALKSEMQNIVIEINNSQKNKEHKCNHEGCECESKCDDCECEENFTK
jgi:prefoldin alpha subunit